MTDVLLVAPYTSVRAGLRVLLSPADDITVAGEARDIATLTYLLGTQPAGAVLIDASPELLEEALTALSDSDIAIVVLTDEPEDAALLARRRPRAWCALTRSAGGDEITAGIRAAAAGIIALDPAHARDLAIGEQQVRTLLQAAEENEAPLTPRESEVLQLMTHGLPNKNIAARLHISLSTAKFHVASILTKLDASSRTEAVTIGARRGLVSL